MNRSKSLRILSFIVISYMLMALLWWAILLYRKNNEAFVLKAQLLEEQTMNTLGVKSVDITELDQYKNLKSSYDRQMYMILGEAAVFGLTLILGIYFINRAFNRELNAAEKQKNFLLSITHELKSPLASINLILSTFIKRDLPHDKIKELSEDGLTESTRLEELFNKILTATRLGTAYQFNFEETNLSNLLKATIDSFAHIHPEVEILSNIQQGVISTLDSEAMVSVLKNLMENALKYSFEKKLLQIDLVSNKEGNVISVNDTGVGIPKEERSKIFDQFYRIGSENTRRSKGTGLGLYIVKQIVDAHNGRIKVDDSPLGGSRFTITL